MTISRNAVTTAENKDPNTFSVAVIGGAGYVGAALVHHLRAQTAWIVEGFDRNARAPKLHVAKTSSYDIPTSLLHTFDAVVYLGGFTGRKVCDAHTIEQVLQENVHDVVAFVRRMLPSQLLVFASTAALGEGFVNFTENDPVNEKLLDRYTWSMLQRENALRALASSAFVSQLIGVRFGTVVGVSPSQRTEFVHVGLMRSAFVNGFVEVTHAETNRALLWIQDQVRALQTLIEQRAHLIDGAKFDLFHLVSFNSRIEAIANAVAAHTGVRTHFVDTTTQNESNATGFSLSNAKFSQTFNFTFEGTQQKVIEDLTKNIDHVILGRELLDETPQSVPCPVCGSFSAMTVLDLGEQPLANDFRRNSFGGAQKFPLRLMRCRKCHHTHLSHIVDRQSLFNTYTYRSGTSRTLTEYFKWLADFVILDTGIGDQGVVLEIACNDGTQLDAFADRGWKTYGVDPAQNIVALAQQNGKHKVQIGFWGVDLLEENLPTAIDAIVAQNVLAHVPDPVSFLSACAKHMSNTTRLYIQTSQCEMFFSGQFDTVYHEHVSFFTAHSFKYLGDRVGLEVVDFRITPIHGRSCLVTYAKKRPDNKSEMSMQQYGFMQVLQTEKERGITRDAFYVQYRGRALNMRTWMHTQLTKLHRLGYALVAYGAAAKGMVLLHFLRDIPNREYEFAYVVDDAPLKQGMFCPGTNVPVKPTSELAKHEPSTRTLVITIFAWNFWDEIAANIARTLKPTLIRQVLILLPFPQQQLLVLDVNTSTTRLVYSNTPQPPMGLLPPKRQRVVLITHFYNEEMLLPYFIRHHASMFDVAVLIDNGSTDKSTDIIRELAPSSWTVVKSRTAMFAADEIDHEVRNYEEMFSQDWKIALTTTEFLVHPNLRQYLSTLAADQKILRFRAFEMIGEDLRPLQRFQHLLQQRSIYSVSQERDGLGHYSRFVHRLPTSLPYAPGRHALKESMVVHIAEHGFVAKLLWTPWPESLQRKLQIRARIPPHHLANGWGVQHDIDAQGLNAKRQQHMQNTQPFDLRRVFATTPTPEGFSVEMADAHQMWRETFSDVPVEME